MTDTDRPVRPFADVIREIRGGRFVDECAAALNEIVEAVHTHAKACTLTIVLKVKPANEKNTDVLIIGDSLTVKKPELELPPTFFYVDEASNLVRDDPNRLPWDGPVRAVPTTPAADQTDQTEETQTA